MDSVTLTSGLDPLGMALPGKDKALPSLKTATQDLQHLVDGEVAEQPFPKPKLNNNLVESSKPFKWNGRAPEFIQGGTSSATSARNSNPALAITGQKQSLHLQGPLALLAIFSPGNKPYSNPLQDTKVLSLREILKMNVEPWVREMATDLLDNCGWPADFAPHPGPYPLNNINPITGQWSLGLQEWTQKYFAWQEGQGDGMKLKHMICVRGWKTADARVKYLRRNKRRTRRELEGLKAALKTGRQEIERANQDKVTNIKIQKETIAKLEEEVVQLKNELVGFGGQAEAIDRLQKHVVQLREENETLTQNEPTLVSTVQRLTAELEVAKDTNRTLKCSLAMTAEEKRKEKSLGSPSRFQPPFLRTEPCTHQAEFATLHKEKSSAEAETLCIRAEMRNMKQKMIVCTQLALEESNRLQVDTTEQLSYTANQLTYARASIRQINRANDTLRDQNTRLKAASEACFQASNNRITALYQEITGLHYSLNESSEAKAKLEAELGQKIRDLETKHQLHTDRLQATIIRMEQDIRGFKEDMKLDDEAKSLLENELNCLKREYERKIGEPKEDAPMSVQKKKRKKKGNGRATQPVVPEKQDVTVQNQCGTAQKQESKQFDEVTLWEKLEMVVFVELVLLLLLVWSVWIHWGH